MATALGWLQHDRGLSLTEEGQILTEAMAILDGRVLYRDIYTFVTPGVWYLSAGLFALTGPSLNAARLLMVAVFVATALVVYALCSATGSRRTGLLAVALLCVQKTLASPLGTILFYTEFSILFSLLGALCLLQCRRGESGRSGRNAMAAGFAFALAVLFKQNVGALSLMLGFAWAALFARAALPALAGVPLVVGLSVLAAFAWAGALPALVDGLIVAPLGGFRANFSIPYWGAFSLSGDFLSNFFYTPGFFAAGGTMTWLFARLLSMALYALPLGLLVSSARASFREGRVSPERALLWAAALGVFSGAFPRSDYAHIAEAMVGFLPIALYELAPARSGWPLRAVGAGIAAMATIGAGLLLWQLPSERNLLHPRARLRVPEAVAAPLVEQLGWIQQSVPPGEAVAVLPFNSILYFLSERLPPVRFTVASQLNLGADSGRAAAAELSASGARFVLYSGGDLPGLPTLDQYAPVFWRHLQRDYEILRSRPQDPGGPALLRRRAASP